MPNRILREGILTSPRVTKLGWGEEVFYRRLMSVVDDFGRFHADPGLLRAACYPRQLGKVSDSDIGKWLTTLVETALVRVYPASDGERYLELSKFGQTVRAKKSRFPDPLRTCIADAMQTTADGPVVVSEDEDGGGDDKRAPEARVLAVDDLVAEGVESGIAVVWLAIRKAKKAVLTQLAWDGVKREATAAGMTPAQAVKLAAESNWQGFKASWVTKANSHAGKQTALEARNAAVKAQLIAEHAGH